MVPTPFRAAPSGLPERLVDLMHVRGQVILQGASGLPEDRFVNVWHFDSAAGSLGTAGGDIMPALDDFYGATIMVGTGLGLAPYLSQYVLRPYSVRLYDMADAEPRVPEIYSRILKPYSTVSGMMDLPEEVAICLSYHTDPPITDRRRGRIYLGPLNHSLTTDATTSQPMRVSTSAQNTLAGLAVRMLDADVGWSIYSPTDDLLHPIVGGWIDNGLDTQRRRGPDTTTRTLWPAP